MAKVPWENTIFSVLISGVKLLVTGLRNALMDSYIFSILYKLIHFSLPFNPAIHRMGNGPNIQCPRCIEQKESQPYFIFYCKLFKITLDIIIELINLKYVFDIFFKITLKTIIMGTSSQFNDGVQLNIFPTYSSDTTSKLNSKETFVKAWSSLLNNNRNLNIQLN